MRRERFVSILFGGAVLTAVVLAPGRASAGTITVNTLAMTLTKDGKCSLLEAVTALNNKAAFNECNPGSGAVTITLPPGLGTFIIPPNSTLTITQPVTLMSAVANTKAHLQATPTSTNSEAILIEPPINATVTLQDLTIDGIEPGSNMIGIFAMGGVAGTKLIVNRCEIEYWIGGGILADGVPLTLTTSYVHDNGGVGVDSIGGLSVNDFGNTKGLFNISNSTLSANTADLGGAIFSGASGHSTILNSSILTNKADYGAAIFATGSGIIDVTASTIALNTANVSAAVQGPGVSFNLTETILAQNTVTVGSGQFPSEWDKGSKIASFTNSLLDSTMSYSNDGSFAGITIVKSSGTNVIDIGNVPVVDSPYTLPDLGGSMLDNVPMVRLLPGCPAIDVLTSSVASTQGLDQRGYPRGIGNGTTRYDIGAFEFNAKAEAESMFVKETINGAVTHVSNVPGFTPAGGTGIKFTPKAGLTNNASFTVRLPLVAGAGPSLSLIAQYGPTAGNYQVGIRKNFNDSFTPIGTMNLYKQQTALAPFVFAITNEDLQPQDYNTMEMQITLVGKDHSSSNNYLYLDSATFFQP